MVNIDTISVILPLLFLVIFQMVVLVRSVSFQPNERSEMVTVDYDRFSYHNLFSKIPGPHDAFRHVSPQRYMFVLLDTLATLMFVIVRFELQGVATSLSVPIIVLAVVFYFFHPLIAIPEYEDLMRKNIEISSFTMYFVLTLILSLTVELTFNWNIPIVWDFESISTAFGLLLIWWYRHVYLYSGLRKEIHTLDGLNTDNASSSLSEKQTTLEEIE